MSKILISPSKYIQGSGEMKKLGAYAANYGKKALVLISKGGYNALADRLRTVSKSRTAKLHLISLMENAVKMKSAAL